MKDIWVFLLIILGMMMCNEADGQIDVSFRLDNDATPRTIRFENESSMIRFSMGDSLFTGPQPVHKTKDDDKCITKYFINNHGRDGIMVMCKDMSISINFDILTGDTMNGKWYKTEKNNL